MRMTRIKMKWLAAAIASLSVSPTWAQSGDVAAQADEQTNMNMQGMDHGGINNTMPEAGNSNQEMDMSGMAHGDMQMQGGSAPPDARDPHAYSGGYTLDAGPYAQPGPRQLRMADEHNFGALLVDRLERVNTRDGDSTTYDAQAWFGRTYNRLVIKAEGDYVGGQLTEASTELLWGHAIATYWDSQLGVRYDSGDGPNRSWLAFGVQGLAPYWFEVNTTAYLGENGRTALSLDAEYDLLLTQKLILQPRVEANLYGKRDAAREIGNGLSDISAGLRLRYEIRREFAPYIGVEQARKYGETGDYARVAGNDVSETRWVAGVRFWF